MEKSSNSKLRKSPIFPINFESQLKECINNKKTPAIILTTGSFCPIHKGHIYSLYDVKNFLEANFHYKVLSIYISPSNNSYVFHKARSFKEFYLTFDQRCKLISKTLETMVDKKEIDDDMFIIDKWEGEHEEFIDSPDVWKTLFLYFQSYFKEKKIEEFKVFYSVGSDMIVRLKYDRYRHKEMALLVTERNSDNKLKYLDDYRKNYDEKNFKEMEKLSLFYLRTKKNYGKFSSTFFRKCIEKKTDKEEDRYEDLVEKEVGEMIERFYEENKKNEGK